MVFNAIYGSRGSRKSSFAYKQINVKDTFKLGIKPQALAFFCTCRLHIARHHEVENREMGLRFKASSMHTMVDDIASVRDAVLFVDEWSSLFPAIVFWSTGRIQEKAREIFGTMDDNPYIEEALVITASDPGMLAFGLYKKLGLWNSLLFERADNIIGITYGIPQMIKGKVGSPLNTS